MASSVKQYLDSLSNEARNAIELIRHCVKARVPESEELINYGILAFALVPGGKRDAQIMVAGYDKHIGFYPGPETIAHFSCDLAGFKRAKGSVQFPLHKAIPMDLVSRMVSHKKRLV
ncbi:MAG: DUF1801 domain-containing protein [Proteobacteria bacterium]|nr:DUF1801 domain-containing protein [Pseudomonadota bacterium]MDA0927254.1 DUF1801 domain-containing protein [Pseudomonadota bacterium]